MRRIIAIFALAVVFSSTQSPPLTQFDAASVKESADAANANGRMRLSHGQIRAQHLPVRSLIAFAHQVEEYQLVGEPEWTHSTLYDIAAKGNAKANWHETGFALVWALERLGPGLTLSTVNCEETPGSPRCRERGITAGSLSAVGTPVESVVRFISRQLAAPVVNETGLRGTFDVVLRWPTSPRERDHAALISTAIQEQLGLKLERRHVPVEVLVVDHIERPSGN